jgi:DNA-binding XRE family transcriptional regulator
MGVASGWPAPDQAARLLWLLRRMQPSEFVGIFRRGLSDEQLLGLLEVLPAQRRGALADRARHASQPPAARGTPDRPDRPLARAVRSARRLRGISQQQLARRVGVCQSAVSQWERGATEPSGLHMAVLLGVLPRLGGLLDTTTAGGTPASTRAS